MKIIYGQIWILYIKHTARSWSLFPCNMNKCFHVSSCHPTDSHNQHTDQEWKFQLNPFCIKQALFAFSKENQLLYEHVWDCRLLSHGSTTNNLEIVSGNKQIVQRSKHLRPEKSIAHLLTTQKKSFEKPVYQKPFVSERYFVALPFITSQLLHMVHCFVIIESLSASKVGKPQVKSWQSVVWLLVL